MTLTEIRDPKAPYELLAVILRGHSIEAAGDGAFVTRHEDPLQVSLSVWEKGRIVAPHRHLAQVRGTSMTQEMLAVRRGAVLVHVYTAAGVYVMSWQLNAGDVVVLLAGGHGFGCVEQAEVLYAKTGPYRGPEADKVYFDGFTKQEASVGVVEE